MGKPSAVSFTAVHKSIILHTVYNYTSCPDLCAPGLPADAPLIVGDLGAGTCAACLGARFALRDHACSEAFLRMYARGHIPEHTCCVHGRGVSVTPSSLSTAACIYAAVASLTNAAAHAFIRCSGLAH